MMLGLAGIIIILLPLRNALERKPSRTENIATCKADVYSCSKACGIKSLRIESCDGQTGICNCGKYLRASYRCRKPKVLLEKELCNNELCKFGVSKVKGYAWLCTDRYGSTIYCTCFQTAPTPSENNDAGNDNAENSDTNIEGSFAEIDAADGDNAEAENGGSNIEGDTGTNTGSGDNAENGDPNTVSNNTDNPNK